ncbi:SGNH/GDSL hydrolase family protein [Streptomyces sp. CC208A]|uniref:SGNH/GDSL hydrolase family protein n=1 Tax=Streptomyces sp. CC208A TaxID=3044573 RepID=UPI0024A80440|nr:SGNH/GDSL hydrolase family protein [Streptomyces sp. CC208A]
MARRIAAGAAYGGGSIGLIGVAAVGVLLAEAQLAKRTVGTGTAPLPPAADGLYGRVFGTEDPLRLALLGDSTAAGQGVRRAGQTPGALLASGLAAVAERPVALKNVALSGARSDDLERQVSLLLAQPMGPPDVCVIMIGANDVTHRLPATESVRLLAAAVRRLRTAGAEVVVGTCPDLGTIEPVYQPLRWLARRASRQLAAAQTIVVVEQGGRTVSLGDLLGPEFAANPREMFGVDLFHPSAEGYATAAMAVLPTLCAALGVWPEPDRLEPGRREGVLPVAKAAAEAAKEAGTEVTGVRAPWALLKHRRRRRLAEPAEAGGAPGEAGEAAGTGGTLGETGEAVETGGAPAEAAGAADPRREPLPQDDPRP